MGMCENSDKDGGGRERRGNFYSERERKKEIEKERQRTREIGHHSCVGVLFIYYLYILIDNTIIIILVF